MSIQTAEVAASSAANTHIATVQELFSKADVLLFKEGDYSAAERIYRQIIDLESRAANVSVELGFKPAQRFIQAGRALDDAVRHETVRVRSICDALNSICYCLKFRTGYNELINDGEIRLTMAARRAASPTSSNSTWKRYASTPMTSRPYSTLAVCTCSGESMLRPRNTTLASSST